MKKTLLLTITIFHFVNLINAQPGTLDSSFGDHGVVRTYLGVNYNFGGGSVNQILVRPNGSIYFTQGNIAKRLANGFADTTYGFNGFSSSAGFDIKKAALQPDGKMVAVGKADVTVRPGDYLYNFGVARFKTDGTLDSSFSGDGKLTTNFKTITNDDGSFVSVEEADAVAIQKDGKIVVAGVSNNYLCLARYKPDGSLDSTFDGDGLLNTYAWNQYYINPNLITVQSDGKIVLAERSNGIFRLNADGSSDNSYSRDNQNYQNQKIYAAVMQDDGKVITSFTYSSGGKDYAALARYNMDGRHDSTFSADGKVITYLVFGQLSLQSSGAIAGLAGKTLKRYNTDGSADKTFGDSGQQIVDFGVGQINDYPPLVLTTQPDGKIVVGGGVQTYDEGYKNYFGLARYNTDGSADTTFGKNGKLIDGLRAKNTVFNSTAIQKDGKIIAAGSTFTGNTFDFAIARYDTTGKPDNTFSTDGSQTTSFTVNSNAKLVAVQSDGKIVAAGEVYPSDYSYNRFGIARYNADGSLDSTFSGDGKLIADSGIDIRSIAIQPDGKIVVGGLRFAVVRYNSDGSLDKTFGTNGKQTNTFPGTGRSVINKIIIQSDGKIVLSGVINNEEQFTGEIGLARLNTDGSLDKTFSNDGKTIYSPGGYTGSSDMIIQKDGKIVVAGNFASGGSTQLSLARFNTDGTLDTSFNGIKTTEEDNYSVKVLLAVQKNDKIVAFGSNTIRFNPDGSIDSTFNTNAKQAAGFGISDLAIGNNKLYAVGSNYFNGNYGAVARYFLDVNGSIWPTVSLLAPADQATYIAPAAHIRLSAAAADKDGTISKVQFYNGTTLLYTDTVAPYGYVWKNVPLGNYTITAKATDNAGLTTTSAPVTIFVVPNRPPTVSITKPTYLQAFTSPAEIYFEAAANDPDGRITKVEFYNDSILLNTQYKAPYSFTWKQDSVAKYFITAVATDNWGATTTDFIYVRVVKPKTIVNSKPYSENQKTALNDALRLRLFPNPATNTINIQTIGLQANRRATLSVISVSGNVLKTMQISNALTQLDVSTLASGVYTIKIVSEDKVVFKQFVKL